MQRARHVPTIVFRSILCCTTLWCLPALAAQPGGEPLKPSAARRVEVNAAAITAELRDVIASTPTVQGERLHGLVTAEPSHWGIRYRDDSLLFSIPVRKNLSLREKADGEIEAGKLALVTLGQKFDRLLELDDASRGLDPAAVRVIFIEPDALRALGGGSGSGGFGGSGSFTGFVAEHGAALDSCPCLPPPPSCGCR